MTPPTYLLPLTESEYQAVRRWLGCPGHDGKRELGKGMGGLGILELRRKVEALAFDMEIPE